MSKWEEVLNDYYDSVPLLDIVCNLNDIKGGNYGNLQTRKTFKV